MRARNQQKVPFNAAAEDAVPQGLAFITPVLLTVAHKASNR